MGCCRVSDFTKLYKGGWLVWAYRFWLVFDRVGLLFRDVWAEMRVRSPGNINFLRVQQTPRPDWIRTKGTLRLEIKSLRNINEKTACENFAGRSGEWERLRARFRDLPFNRFLVLSVHKFETGRRA